MDTGTGKQFFSHAEIERDIQEQEKQFGEFGCNLASHVFCKLPELYSKAAVLIPEKRAEWPVLPTTSIQTVNDRFFSSPVRPH